MWWSLNVHVGVVPLGILGPEFGLSLGQSIAASVVGTALGALCTSFTGSLGPKLGLRQIATSRYSFGFWGAKLCSFLNVIVGGGFAVVNYVRLAPVNDLPKEEIRLLILYIRSLSDKFSALFLITR